MKHSKKKVVFIIIVVIIVIVFIFLYDYFQPYLGIDTSSKLSYERVEFSLQEDFSDKYNGPNIYLSISTEEQYGCGNFGLAVLKNQINNNIYLKLGSVIDSDICLTSFGPAEYKDSLNLKPGSYTLNLIRKNQTDKYTVDIETTEINIKPVSTPQFSNLLYSKIYRLPNNLMWARCFYNGDVRKTPTDAQVYCSNFYKELLQIVEMEQNLGQELVRSERYFIYKKDDQKLFDLVKKFHRQNFYINIQNWKGKSFICQINDCITTTGYIPDKFGPRLY